MSQLVSSRLFAAAVLATTLAMPACALAQTRTSDEQNAVVDSYTDTPEGCVIVSLMISSVTQDPPGQQVAMSSLAIYRAWANMDCATFIADGGAMDSIASGNTLENPTEFKLDQRLMTGTVKTTMSIYFYATGEERPVTIDLVLSGIEGTLSPVRLGRDLYPGSTSGWVLGHSRGYYRDATASGSVSDGVTNYFGNAYAVKGFLRVWHTQISGPRPRLLH